MSDRPVQQPESPKEEPRLRIAETPDGGPAQAGRQLELTMLDVVIGEVATTAAREAEITIRDIRVIFRCCPVGEHQHVGSCKLLPSLPGTVNCVRIA